MIACQLGETQIVKSLLAEQSIDANAVDNVRLLMYLHSLTVDILTLSNGDSPEA